MINLIFISFNPFGVAHLAKNLTAGIRKIKKSLQIKKFIGVSQLKYDNTLLHKCVYKRICYF